MTEDAAAVQPPIGAAAGERTIAAGALFRVAAIAGAAAGAAYALSPLTVIFGAGMFLLCRAAVRGLGGG